jgi:hypothetical protein
MVSSAGAAIVTTATNPLMISDHHRGAPPNTSGHKAMIRNTIVKTQPKARLLEGLTSWTLLVFSWVSAILSFPIAGCGSL